MLLSAAVCRSQARVIERLADGSIRIEIDGTQYLAITRAQLDAWQILQNNHDKLVADVKDKDVQIKEALLQRDLAQAREALIQQKSDSFEKDFNRAKEDSVRWHDLFISERELRNEARQFVPHGSKTKLDKVLAFFDRPATVSFFKIGLPLIQTWRCQ